jgi:hypothetical protein
MEEPKMGLIENLKDIAELAKAVGNIELYRRIVDLEGEIIELTRRSRSLETELEEQKNAWQLKGNITFRTPFYYVEGDQYPFCPRCWEVDKRTVHVSEGLRTLGGQSWHCPECDNTYLEN